MKKIFCLSICAMFAVVFATNAAIVKNGGNTVEFSGSAVDYGDADYDLQGLSEMEAISTLRAEIQSLDEQIKTCEKQRKGWIAATVVGGAGVLGTGIGAIVQGKKVSENKAERDSLKEQLTAAKKETKAANAELDNVKKQQQ